MKAFIKNNWILLCFILGALTKGINTEYIIWKLSKKGVPIKVVLNNKKWESLSYRNEDGYYYNFKINGILYEGHTMTEIFLPGDSIEVLYLKDNPSVNRPKFFVFQ